MLISGKHIPKGKNNIEKLSDCRKLLTFSFFFLEGALFGLLILGFVFIEFMGAGRRLELDGREKLKK